MRPGSPSRITDETDGEVATGRPSEGFHGSSSPGGGVSPGRGNARGSRAAASAWPGQLTKKTVVEVMCPMRSLRVSRIGLYCQLAYSES